MSAPVAAQLGTYKSNALVDAQVSKDFESAQMNCLRATVSLIFMLLALNAPSAQDVTTSSLETAGDQTIIQDLITVLKDDDLRQTLVRELESTLGEGDNQSAQPSATEPEATGITENDIQPPGLIDEVLGWIEEAGRRIPTATFGIPIDQKLGQAATQLATRIDAGATSGALNDLLFWQIPVLLAAFLGSVFGRRLQSGRVRSVQGMPIGPLLIGLAAKFAFHGIWMLATLIILQIVSPPLGDMRAIFALGAALLVAPAIADLATASLALMTRVRSNRLLAYAQTKFYKWILVIAVFGISGALCRDAAIRRAIGWSTADVAGLVLDLCAAILFAAFVLRNRLAIENILLRGANASAKNDGVLRRGVRGLANRWHIIAIAFVLLSSLGRLIGQRSYDLASLLLSSVAILALAAVLIALVGQWHRWYLDRYRRAWPSLRKTAITSAAHLAKIALNIATILAASNWIGEIWGFRVGAWATGAGLPITTPLLIILLSGSFAWFVWRLLDGWIESALTPNDAFGRPRVRSDRLKTLLPLIRNVMTFVIIAVTGISVLANIGVNVTPFIAGAGVFGLAVSFGSQQLVQDVITGVFILAEDTISIGDTINTGDRSGVVEGLTIRTIRLRDADGALHSIPFSTVKALKNSSRNYGVFRPRYSVPPNVDPDDVMNDMRRISQELRAGPLSNAMLSDLHQVGIEEISAAGVVVSGTIRTRPLKQPEVARAFNSSLRVALKERGVF